MSISKTHGDILNIKEPGFKRWRAWQPLIEQITHLILTSPKKTANIGVTTIRVKIEWTARRTLPKSGFPPLYNGTYDAERVLLWAYQNKLAPYSPAMLYSARRSAMIDLQKLEKIFTDVEIDVDKLVEGVYNDGIE